MNYEDRVVCFIDILGFRSHISKTIDKDSKEVAEETGNLIKAFNVIKNVNAHVIDDVKTKKVTQFSDCLVISFVLSEKSEVFCTLKEIQWLLIELVKYGILCRGGITFGKLVHTDDIVFGPALVDAYILESKAANYPRVLVDNSILDIATKYHASHHGPQHEIESIKECLGLDSDGMFYIDYILEITEEFDDLEDDYAIFLNSLSELIEEHIDSPKPDIRVKYSWLKEKYNEAVKYQQSVAKNCSDSDLTDAFITLPVFEQ